MIKSFSTFPVYSDTGSLSKTIKEMEFKDSIFGEELPEFPLLQNELKDLLNTFSPFLEVSENSGIFRKPYNIIHFEDIPIGLVLVGICAIEKTTITFYKHLESNADSFFELNGFDAKTVLDDTIFPEKFHEKSKIIVEPGEIFFFSPAMFHKVESELTQMFYLNAKVKENEQSTETTKES